MGASRKRRPMDTGEGPWPETYNTAKRRRHWSLGLVRCTRQVADLLAAIEPGELRALSRGDLARRIIEALAELGALQLEAAGVDEENDNDVKQIQESRRRASEAVLPVEPVWPGLAARPYWLNRRDR